MSRARLALLCVLALLAFAANSLLCRLALRSGGIDAASFATLRVAAGVAMLVMLARGRPRGKPDWLAAAMLWLYMAAFAYAYLSLSAGSGALILFAAVQLTMFGAGLRAGERFAAGGWAGLALAFGGLVYLVLPGLEAPQPLGATLMAVAGVAWGGYSLRGRASGDPLAATAGNFVRALPLCLALSLVALSHWHVQPRGALLAIASGAITSGLGYVIWYAALPGLTAMRAATLQLAVPPLAALGGVLLMGELLTARLLLASAAILGGIALVLLSRAGAAKKRS